MGLGCGFRELRLRGTEGRGGATGDGVSVTVGLVSRGVCEVVGLAGVSKWAGTISGSGFTGEDCTTITCLSGGGREEA